LHLLDARPRAGFEQLREGRADPLHRRLGDEDAVQLLGEPRVEPREQLRGPPGRTEPAQGLERGQRVDELRLVVPVLEVALRRVHGDAGSLLLVESRFGASHVRVDLKGQRGLGCDDLEQVGERRTEAGHDVLAQGRHRVGGDEHVETHGATVPRSARGRARMSAHPDLGDGRTGSFDPQQMGDGRRRPPRVALGGAADAVHGVLNGVDETNGFDGIGRADPTDYAGTGGRAPSDATH
jgi:hypothetical protein